MPIAAAAGGIGYLFSQRAVFLLVPVFSLLAAIAMMLIPARAIDEDRGRGLGDCENAEAEEREKPYGYSVLLRCRPLVVFGVFAMLFHVANAPVLPLVGQKLAQAHSVWATAMMSSSIIAAQLIMLPVALSVGRTAERIGRKPTLLVGSAVLPARALLDTFSDNSAWLIGVLLLDGVGAGIFSAITLLLIADVMRGTGRYNLAQGAVATAQWVGASLSGLAAGVIVDYLATRSLS